MLIGVMKQSVGRCDEVLEGMVGVGMCDHQCSQV